MVDSADVVVIGGGCAGTAATYFLSRAGLQVTLVEREGLASGASLHGTGISRLNFRDTDMPAHAELSRRHRKRLERIVPVLEDETGIDTECQHAPGMTIPLTDEAWERMREIGAAEGLAILSGDAARELEPNLNPEIPGVVWEASRRKISGLHLATAYAKAAEQRGAEIVLAEATGLDVRDGRVAGVHTTSGTIPCGAVVIAMGLWAPVASEWLGIDIPVKPIKGEGLWLQYSGPRAKHFFTPEGLRPGFVEQGHVICRLNGIVSAGSTVEDVGWDDLPTPEARDRILRMAVYIWPALAESEILDHLVGFRPVPGDGLPILGPVPGIEGAFVIAGHSAISRSALYAEITRDYIVDGQTTALDSMEPFLLERFLRAPAGDGPVYGVIREAREAAPVIHSDA